MEKAIFIGFELLMFVALLGGSILMLALMPWPMVCLAVFPLGGTVLVGMIIFDMARN